MTRTLLLAAGVLSACGNVEDKVVPDAAPSDGAAVDTASIDAMGDAGMAAFDVIYGDDWRIAVDATNSGWFLLVANGNSDPDLSTIQITAISDDHPLATVRIVANPITGLITHGRVAGAIFIDNQTVYLAGIPEQRSYVNEGLMSLTLLDAPAGDYMINTHLEGKVNNIPFALDFKVHHVDSPITYCSPETVKRLTVRH